MLKKINQFFELGTGKLTFGNIIAALVIFFISLFVIKLIMKVVKNACVKAKLDQSAVGYITVVVRIALYFVAILLAADTLGIPISSLLAVFSIIGLALSLSVQDLLSNLISGFVILVSKPFVSDDFIEIAGKSGTVKSIGFMHTTLLTPDHKITYIPNHEITVSTITNYSREEIRRVELSISTSYNNSADEVKKSITRSFSEVKEIMTAPEPFVGLKQYGASSVTYDVRVWCRNCDYWKVYYSLNELIKVNFDKDGIEMTYDHINVHVVEK